MSEICHFLASATFVSVLSTVLDARPLHTYTVRARSRAVRARFCLPYRIVLSLRALRPNPNRSPVPRPRSRGLPRPLLLTYDPAPLALRRTCGRRRRSDAAPRTRPLGSLDDDGPRVAPPRRSHRTRPPRVARRQRGTRAGGARPRASRKRAAGRGGRGGGGTARGGTPRRAAAPPNPDPTENTLRDGTGKGCAPREGQRRWPKTRRGCCGRARCG